MATPTIPPLNVTVPQFTPSITGIEAFTSDPVHQWLSFWMLNAGYVLVAGFMLFPVFLAYVRSRSLALTLIVSTVLSVAGAFTGIPLPVCSLLYLSSILCLATILYKAFAGE